MTVGEMIAGMVAKILKSKEKVKVGYVGLVFSDSFPEAGDCK